VALLLTLVGCGTAGPPTPPIRCDQLEDTRCWHVAFAAIRKIEPSHVDEIVEVTAGNPDLCHLPSMPCAATLRPYGVADVLLRGGMHRDFLVWLSPEGNISATETAPGSVFLIP